MFTLLDRDSFANSAGESRSAEAWRYYPSLNFGVFVHDGVVAGISVTPAK